MTARLLVFLIGLVSMAAGVIQVFRPRPFWLFWENLLVDYLYQPPPATLYVFGAIYIIMGLFLLYAGIRRLTIFSTFIWILGALLVAVGLVMVMAPRFFRDFVNSVFYFRSDSTKLVLSYIGGIGRFFIGILLMIAGLTRSPRQSTPELAQPTAHTEEPQTQ